jgi:hypothetical protein
MLQYWTQFLSFLAGLTAGYVIRIYVGKIDASRHSQKITQRNVSAGRDVVANNKGESGRQ